MRRPTTALAVAGAVLVGCGGGGGPPPKGPVVNAVREWVRAERAGNLDRFCTWTIPTYDLPPDVAHKIGLSPDSSTSRPGDVRKECAREFGYQGRLESPAPGLRIIAIHHVVIGPAIKGADGISRTARVITTEREGARGKSFPGRHDLVRYRGSWKVVYGFD